jgi:2-oxoisovalerate dehydrogenase E1 component
MLVEDNAWAISTPVEKQTAGGSISAILEGFPSLFRLEVDGTDFMASYHAMREAVEYCRSGQGPALVHAHVIRPYSHSLSDDERLYKTVSEREREAALDPNVKFPEWLVREGILDRHSLQRIVHEVDVEVQEITERVLKAPAPPPGSALLYLYSDKIDPASSEFESAPQFEGDPRTMVDEINLTLHEEMRR